MTKPPTPNSDRTRYRDAFLFPGIFYLQTLSAILLVLALASFASRFVPVPEFWLSFLVFSIVLASLIQLGVKIRRNVQERGLPPWGVVGVFVATLLAPAALILVFRGGPDASEGENAARALYEAQRSFHASFGTYSLSVREVGLEPRLGRSAFALGFATACAIQFGMDPDRALLLPEGAPWVAQRKLEVVEVLRNLRAPNDCRSPKEGFEGFALGVAREGGPLEIWRVDERGKVERLGL